MLAMRELRAVLSRRGFRRLLAVRLSSQFGDGLFQAGIGGSLLFNPQQRTSAVAIAIGFAILLLPYSFIGPYVGVFLDRWSRRNILVAANFIRSVLVLPAALLVWFGHSAELSFGLIALIIVAINRFFLADISASLPHVADDERLATANAVSNTFGTLAYTAGLASAIGLLGVVGTRFHGYGIIVLTSLLGFGTAALLARVLFCRLDLGPDDAERPRASVWHGLVSAGRGMIDGARHLHSRPIAFHALLAQGFARGLYGLLAIAALLFARTLGHGTEFLGLVFVTGAIGALTAAVITPAATRRWGGPRWLLILLIANALTVAALAPAFDPLPLLIAVFTLNIASMGVKIVVDTSLQHECDDEFRGRVFSVNDTAFNVFYVVGLFVGAFVLPDNGRSVAIIVGVTIGYALLSAWYYAVSRSHPSQPHGETRTLSSTER